MFGGDRPGPSEKNSSCSAALHQALFLYPAAATAASSDGKPATQSLFASNTSEDTKINFTERAVSAAGAAFLSAIIVNPFDVVKTRLQAQAAVQAAAPGSYQEHVRRHMGSLTADYVCPPVCPRGGASGATPLCPPSCFQYTGTFDVFYKIVRQEGILRLWRGTNAGLALAVPTVGIYLPCYDMFRDWLEKYSANHCPRLAPYTPLVAGSVARSLACIICSPIELARVRMQAQRELRGGKPPGMLKTLFGVLKGVRITSGEPLLGVRALWTGVGAQLARDVPFSAICWATLEPIRQGLSQRLGSEASAVTVLGSNFTAGVIAGSIAAAATCPLDVAKTRRQIQDPSEVLMKTSTRQVLAQIWRQGGLSGLFMGVVPRVARAGPSVGIVVSCYEMVKYALHKSHHHSPS